MTTSTRRKRHRSNADTGFTLIEATISITLVGLISVVMANVFSVIVRNTPKTDERIDNAKTLQGVVTWLPQDVDSTPSTGFFEASNVATGCSDGLGGVNLLHMAWTETASSGGTVQYYANYRDVLVNGRSRIKRVTCFGTPGSEPFGNARVLNVSSALPALPGGWAQGQAPAAVTVDRSTGLVSLVTFAITNLNGQVISVEAAPKNPAATLPSTTGVPVPTTAATTTTSTTTTTIAATTTTNPLVPTTLPAPTTSTSTTTTTLPPCVVTSAAISPDNVKNTAPNGNGSSAASVGVLAQPVTVTIVTTGYCNGIEARATTGAPNGELFHNFTATATGYSVTFPGYPQGSSELWADGVRPIKFYSPTGGPYGSGITLLVK